MPYRVNNGSARGWPFRNHAMNVRGTDTATESGTRTSIVYPRRKFTYLVEIGLNSLLDQHQYRMLTDVRKYITDGRLYASLRSIDHPKPAFKVEKLRSYNKWVSVPQSVEYQSATINFHDDNTSMASALWLESRAFYQTEGRIGAELLNTHPADGRAHYFNASQIAEQTSGQKSFHSGMTGDQMRGNQDYAPSLGLNLRSHDLRHFLDYIILYDLGSDPDSVNTYVFVRPMFTSTDHDQMDYEDRAANVGMGLTFEYEGYYHLIGENNNRYGQSFEGSLDVSPMEAAKSLGHAIMTPSEAKPSIPSGSINNPLASSGPTGFTDSGIEVSSLPPLSRGLRPEEATETPGSPALPPDVGGSPWQPGGSIHEKYVEPTRDEYLEEVIETRQNNAVSIMNEREVPPEEQEYIKRIIDKHSRRMDEEGSS